MLQNQTIYPLYTTHDKIYLFVQDKDFGSVLYDAKDSIESINIDVSIEDEIKLVMKAIEEDDYRRLRPLLASSRGVGGGKSFLCERLRVHLMSYHPDLLTLAITFHNDHPLTNLELIQFDKELQRCFQLTEMQRYKNIYSLTILARLISNFYGIDLETSIQLICNDLRNFTGKLNPINMISDFISFMILKLNATEKEIPTFRKITGFFLIMDETIKVEENLSNYFPDITLELMKVKTKVVFTT